MPTRNKSFLHFSGSCSGSFTASLNAFIFSGAQVLLIALFPFLAHTLRLPLATVIASFSLGSFLFLFGSPYWSGKSDRIGRIKVLQQGLAALLISFALIVALLFWPSDSVAVNFTFLLLSRVIYGLVASSLAPVAQTLQADLAENINKRSISSSAIQSKTLSAPQIETDLVTQTTNSSSPQPMTQAMLKHSLSLNLGRIAGLSLMVIFTEHIHTVLLIYLIFIGLSLVFTLLQKDHFQPQTLKTESDRNWKTDFFNLKFIFATALVFTCFVETLNSSLGGSLQAVFQLPPLTASSWTAQILLSATIGVAIVQIFARVFSRMKVSFGLLLGSLCLLTGALVFTLTRPSLPQALWVAIGFFVIGIGLIPPFYLSALRRQNSNKANHGRQAGFIGLAHTLGYAFGSALAAASFYFGALQTGLILCGLSLILVLFSVKTKVQPL